MRPDITCGAVVPDSMLQTMVRGAMPAIIALAIALLGLYWYRQLVLVIAVPFGAWFLFSSIRFVWVVANGRFRRTSSPEVRESFFFWLGAAMACLLALVVYAVVGAAALSPLYPQKPGKLGERQGVRFVTNRNLEVRRICSTPDLSGYRTSLTMPTVSSFLFFLF